MRAAACAPAVLAALALAACKRAAPEQSDAATLAQLFAGAADAPSAGASADPAPAADTAEALPSLRPVAPLPPPVTAGPKPAASAAASAAAPSGNPNLPQCVVARAFCAKGLAQCEAKKQECVAAGGRM